MAVVAAPPSRDDDLAVKLAFTHLLSLDEAFAEGIAAMQACKEVGEVKAEEKASERHSRAAHSAAVAPASVHRARAASSAGHGRGDDLAFPNYLVRQHTPCNAVIDVGVRTCMMRGHSTPRVDWTNRGGGAGFGFSLVFPATSARTCLWPAYRRAH
jgi:hypothetical protein